jgi:ADP-ribose pyrophosphatase
MDRINGIKKLTDNRYLNLYELDATFRDGSRAPYYVASRRKSADLIKAASHDNHPDGVILCGVYGEEKDRLVLIRQYRYPIDGYVYEFPAGLVEPGEDMVQAGIREMKEETGLSFSPVHSTQPFFMTVGMTDESCGFVFGYCDGQPTNAHQEGSEDIQVVLADRAECRRILKEELVAMPCALVLMQFINGESDLLAGFAG